MDISQREAHDSLAAVELAVKKTKKAIASQENASCLMMWGVIWIVAYIATHLCVQFGRFSYIWPIWLGLCGIGTAATFCVAWYQWRSGRPKRSPPQKKLGWRIFGFWVFLFVFIFIWLSMMAARGALNGIQLNAFMVTAIMFGYVVSGLWTDGAYMVYLGLAVTATTLAGYFMIPPVYYNLWMAPTGGGSLFFTGLYIHLRWR